MRRLLFTVVGSLVALLAGCVGAGVSDSGGPTTSGGPPGSTGGANDGGTSLAPDAAPPAGCPLGCLPPAPAGWLGPSAVFDGPPADKPAACPAPYTAIEVEAHQGMTAEAASCACGAVSVVGATCEATVELHTNPACTTTLPIFAGVITAPGDSCLTIMNSTSSLVVNTATLKGRGTCAYPSATTTKADPVYATVDVACGLPQSGTCEGRPDCASSPVPDAPFTRVCIHEDGDQPCPSADYANRFVAFRSVADDRSCTACTATPEGGSCGTMWGKGVGAGCSASPTEAHVAGTCASNPGINGLIDGSKLGPTGITCPTTGGEPAGAVVDAEPVTFCCNR